jgi:membrane-bound serine protease (ClpP class)
VLGLLGTSVLPLEASAIALFVIGCAAIALEVKLPSHGILGGAGVVALVLAGLLMVDPDEYFGGMRGVQLQLFAPLIVGAALGFVVIARATRKALEAPAETGSEALIAKRGTARSAFGAGGQGQVFVDGARWQAVTDDPEIRLGDSVEVVAVSRKPTRLRVRRIERS